MTTCWKNLWNNRPEVCHDRCDKKKLVADADDHAVGVVSKTDLMGAFYAGLPLDFSLEAIMVGPPVYCHPDDLLEKSLESMSWFQRLT